MLDIKITKTTSPKEKPAADQPLGFGKIFTDHMFIMDYTEGKGWHDPRIVPFQNISLSPAAMVYHYGQEMFEGLKVFSKWHQATLHRFHFPSSGKEWLGTRRR